MEYLQKLQAAEKSGGYDRYVDLLTIIRKENKRVPHIVLKYGTILIEKHAYRLGDTRKFFLHLQASDAIIPRIFSVDNLRAEFSCRN